MDMDGGEVERKGNRTTKKCGLGDFFVKRRHVAPDRYTHDVVLTTDWGCRMAPVYIVFT